ncbi:MAG: glycosyltransferase [Chloroflexota bacterium]
MTFIYHSPSGVEQSHAGGRPLLSLPQGGRVALDRRMLAVWKSAQGRDLPGALQQAAGLGLPPAEAAAGLACLAQAGLLERRAAGLQPQTVHPDESLPPPVDALVSVIVVSYNSRAWLPACFESLARQSHPRLEVVLVDNASSDDSLAWTAARYPQIHALRLETLQPLAGAINAGVQASHGDYLLVLNPDVALDPQAVGWLLVTAHHDPRCAAAAAKLRFLWAPAFLNGLGNLVGAFSWGADFGLGHLDLGQFDHLPELPSACFAAALLPRPVFEAVGPLDAGFVMYYEDSEWCYRARLLGYRVLPAHQAVVYHAFSSRVPDGSPAGLADAKLQRVVYGRLHWITLLLGDAQRRRFALNYSLEDALRLALAWLRRRPAEVRAYRLARREYFAQLPSLLQQRAALQARRAIDDVELFRPQLTAPLPLVWRGLPLLTWDIVRSTYMPWLAQGAWQALPEWQDGAVPPPPGRPEAWPRRAAGLLRQEGPRGLLYRLARGFAWRLSRP